MQPKVKPPATRIRPCLHCGKWLVRHYQIGLKKWQCSNCKHIVIDKSGHSSYMGVS